MTKYQNNSGESGIVSYQIYEDSITVEFEQNSKNGHRFYSYTYTSAGKTNIEEMKKLAIQGSGLNSYINLYVKKDYARSW